MQRLDSSTHFWPPGSIPHSSFITQTVMEAKFSIGSFSTVALNTDGRIPHEKLAVFNQYLAGSDILETAEDRAIIPLERQLSRAWSVEPYISDHLVWFLPTTLAGHVMRSVVSACPPVCLSVCFHFIFWTELTFKLELLCVCGSGP